MDIINNLGIGYIGDYISQGSQVDKSKKSTQLGIKYTEFVVRNDGKNMDFSNITNFYTGKTIFHLPTININQTNLKSIKDTLNELLKNNISLITIDASTLLYETFDWSTDEEQKNYLKNMAKAIASLVSSNIPLAIENTNMENNTLLFGKTISNMSDLLVYTRNALVEQFDFTRDKANNMVGISLNVAKLIKTNEIVDLESWFKVFNKDIKCIKVNNVESTIPMFSKLLDLVIENNIDVPIILETSEEIESVVNQFKKLEYLVKNKIEGRPMNFSGYQNIVNSRYNEYNYNFNSAQSGYTNAVIICMILFTVIAAILMLIIQIRQ